MTDGGGAKLLLERLADDTLFCSKVFLQCHFIKRESRAAPRITEG